jgi:ribose transport system substrate-binding protein
VIRSDGKTPQTLDREQAEYRLVMITQDINTPFWDNVSKGALKQAQKEDVSLEIWGSYGNNKEDFLKKLEIAIHSKVDGIIVQGLDTDQFKNLTRIKSSFYGIPIITVANDVPMAESLRRTYVGTDQYQAGKMIAEQLLLDMGESGNVILMYDNHLEYYQEQRLSGMEDVLKGYPDVNTLYAETSETRDQVIATTQDMLNQMPDVDAFIAINASITGAMIHEIGNRYQVEPYYIYAFDDTPEALSLLRAGKVDGIIQQSPEMMGGISVKLMMEWLSGKTVPLEMDGYYTDIDILKASDTHE